MELVLHHFHQWENGFIKLSNRSFNAAFFWPASIFFYAMVLNTFGNTDEGGVFLPRGERWGDTCDQGSVSYTHLTLPTIYSV